MNSRREGAAPLEFGPEPSGESGGRRALMVRDRGWGTSGGNPVLETRQAIAALLSALARFFPGFHLRFPEGIPYSPLWRTRAGEFRPPEGRPSDVAVCMMLLLTRPTPKPQPLTQP
jgi:hypothetical protein